jgi:hypothetical protein
MSESKNQNLFPDTERILIEVKPKLRAYGKSDEILSDIEQVFSLNLSRSIDTNTFDDIKASLDKITDTKSAIFLIDLLANFNLEEMKFVETMIEDVKLCRFLRKLMLIYGALTFRARQAKFYPDEWNHVHTEPVGDPHRGFMMRSDFRLGSGKRVSIMSSPDGSIVLARHIIRNIVNYADSVAGEEEGKERRLIQFVNPQNINRLEKTFEELKQKIAQLKKSDSEITEGDLQKMP